jgi:hypothetical protein
MLGKITIIKTLVLPHISFVGCILEPPGNWLNKVQERIEKFVLGKEQIARERIYLPVRSGGIGMIDLRTFLTAQKAGWVKKALASTNDTWKYEINIETNNFNRWDPEQISLELNKNIIAAALEIRIAYTKINNNFLTVPILNNTNFGTGRGRQRKFDTEFFTTNLNFWDYRTANITWSDLITNSLNFKSHDEINVQLGHQITLATYTQLKSGYEIAKKRFYVEGGKATKFEAYLKRIPLKGAAKKLRRILEHGSDNKVIPARLVKKFSESIGLHEIAEPAKKNMLGLWATTFLPVEIRTFLFKFYSNKLNLNARATHFNLETNAGCDFCILNNILPAPKETAAHLFWDCTVSKKFIDTVHDKYLGPPHSLTKQKFFTGTDVITENSTDTIRAQLIIFDIIKYVLWETKWQKTKLNLSVAVNRFDFLLKTVLGTGKKFKNICTNNNVFYLRRDE